MNNSNITQLWIVKHRPKTIDQLVVSEGVKNKVKKWIIEKNIPNLILIGRTGTGKTSLATILINNIDAEPLIFNASDERGIETIREKVKKFAQTSSPKLKIIFMDEADQLTPEAQQSLRNIIETYAHDTRFIFTGNSDKFIDEIKDRCIRIDFKDLPKEEIFRYLLDVLTQEEVLFNPDEINQLIDAEYPSIRTMLGIIQDNIEKDDSGNLSFKFTKSKSITKEILRTIFEMYEGKESITDIRRVLIESKYENWDEIYSYYFNKLIEKDKILGIIVAEFRYRATFNIDQEINFFHMLACLETRLLPYNYFPPVESQKRVEDQITSDRVSTVKRSSDKGTIILKKRNYGKKEIKNMLGSSDSD